MEQYDNSLSKTGSKLICADKLQSREMKMSNLATWDSFKAIVKILFKEIGRRKGLCTLIKTGIWNDILSRPKWHPEYFQFKDEIEEKHYKKIFKSMVPLITIFEHLKKKYGESRADEIVAKMAVPIALPFLSRPIHHIDGLEDIDQFRQMICDYLGSGAGFEWEEKVSEDKTELRYRFTKCVYGEIIAAYGLKTFSVYSCLADHVIFDNVMPEIVFGRKHTITLGDGFCDHMFRIRLPEDEEKDETNYADCYKISGGRELVKNWEKNYKKNKGHFEL